MGRRDRILCVALYILGLCITLSFAIFRQQILSDQTIEYQLYLDIIKTGSWSYQADNIVNSCLLVTLVPAYIQRLTHIDPDLLFKIFPYFFYSLMLPFVYLIARRYLNVWYSLLAVALLLSHYYFAYYPALGRVVVAWGLWSGVVYGLLSKKYILVVVLAGLVVFSHYGTAFIIGGTLVISLGYYLWTREKRGIIYVGSILLVVAVVIGVWYFGMAKEPGRYAGLVISASIESFSSTIMGETGGMRETGSVLETWKNNTEPVVLAAFGSNWSIMNIPQKIELCLSWLIVGLITIGIVWGTFKHQISRLHSVVAVSFYTLLVIVVIVPYIASMYGIVRLYFTAMPLFAVCFIFGAKKIAEWWGVNQYGFCAVIIGMYGLAVSGGLHRLFGIVK